MNTQKRIIRKRPRLLYAGINNALSGWLTADKVSHDNAEIVLIGKGSGKLEAGGAAYPFKAGDLLVFNSDCPHRDYFDPSGEHEMLFVGIGNLSVAGRRENAILKDRDFCLIHTEQYFPALHCYMSQLVAESEGNQPLKGEITERLLDVALLFAVRLADFDAGFTFNENKGYLEAKKYFDEHFTEIDNIENVCKSLYINKYYLSHLFAQNLGMPPVKYLIGKRIALACQYLETTDMNVCDIGKACGYVDPCYFSRVFRKEKGVTPLRYRYLFKLEKSGKKE